MGTSPVMVKKNSKYLPAGKKRGGTRCIADKPVQTTGTKAREKRGCREQVGGKHNRDKAEKGSIRRKGEINYPGGVSLQANSV